MIWCCSQWKQLAISIESEAPNVTPITTTFPSVCICYLCVFALTLLPTMFDHYSYLLSSIIVEQMPLLLQLFPITHRLAFVCRLGLCHLLIDCIIVYAMYRSIRGKICSLLSKRLCSNLIANRLDSVCFSFTKPILAQIDDNVILWHQYKIDLLSTVLRR